MKIPVVSVTKSVGVQLRAQPGPATIKLNASGQSFKARNVIAQTKTGSPTDVVMAGAHLDSVPEGPGINDNGSGVAAILETAVRLGNSPQVHNAVRFGFWGAEELGLIGSRNYVESLDLDGLKNIALYLNFDMLASPNPGYFTYDGDQSLPADTRGQPVVPEGSAGIERTLVAYLKSTGKTAQDTSFDGRSDYDGFTLAGIPAGGLFSGAEVKMSDDQAKLWGGTADQPFDPNYHQKTDTLDHIDRTALGINGGGVAYAVGLYAQDLGGHNGVPTHGGPHASRAHQAMIRPAGRGSAARDRTAGGLLVAAAGSPRLPHRIWVMDLAAKVTAERMFTHLHALQNIANANKGNRADGTPGYDASVDYVAKALRDRGFDVSTPAVRPAVHRFPGKPALTVAGRSYQVDQASLLVQTPPGGLTGQPVRPTQPSGCAASDYPAALPTGAIAVVDDAAARWSTSRTARWPRARPR